MENGIKRISYFDGYVSDTSSKSVEIASEEAMAVAGLEMLRNGVVTLGESAKEQPKDLDYWEKRECQKCGPFDLVEIDPRDREAFKSMKCAAWNACPGATNCGLLILPGIKANEEIHTKYNYTSGDSKGLKYVNEKAPSVKKQRIQWDLMLAAKKQKRERIKARIARARAQKTRPSTDECGARSSNDF